MLFFFKQKTAYEMRISDWSSDVCSSDLQVLLQKALLPLRAPFDMLAMKLRYYFKPLEVQALGRELQWHLGLASWPAAPGPIHPQSGTRSEERRVGKECVSTCRSRWSPYH